MMVAGSARAAPHNGATLRARESLRTDAPNFIQITSPRAFGPMFGRRVRAHDY